MIKNNLSHNSGAKSTLCNVAMKGSPLLSHIFIRTWPFCFAVTWCPYSTSVYLSVSYNESGMKSETSGVMWHVAPESKIQLVNCELSPKFSLGNSSLPNNCAIDAYIFWSLLFSPLEHARLPFLFKRTYFWRFSIYFGGFGHFAIMWYSDTHLKHFRGVRYVCLLSRIPFLGRRSVNGSVQWIDVSLPFGKHFIATKAWTENTYVNSWGTNPTRILNAPIRRRTTFLNIPINLRAVARRTCHDRLWRNRVERRQTIHRELHAQILLEIRDEFLYNDSNGGWLEELSDW